MALDRSSLEMNPRDSLLYSSTRCHYSTFLPVRSFFYTPAIEHGSLNLELVTGYSSQAFDCIHMLEILSSTSGSRCFQLQPPLLRSGETPIRQSTTSSKLPDDALCASTDLHPAASQPGLTRPLPNFACSRPLFHPVGLYRLRAAVSEVL